MRIVSSTYHLILVLIIAVAGILMVNAALGDSLIFDETAHIISGYNNLKNLDYRFNPEHPPLVKMLAALPLLFLDLNFPKDQPYWSGINEQWSAGGTFLYQSGNNADWIIFLARIGPIILTLLLITAVYFFGRTLIGKWWALLPAFLTAFSPIVLGHGHLVTTDTGTALGILIAIWAFLNDLHRPTPKTFLVAAITFGLTQTIKFSSVLLIPLFLVVSLIYIISWRRMTRSILLMIAGYILVVYPIYTLTTWNYPTEEQVSDTSAILQNFALRPFADLTATMTKQPLTKPIAQYLLGVLIVFQRSAGGNNAFFLGQLSSHGWWYYFPLIYLMKESLPVLLLIFYGAIHGAGRIFYAAFRSANYWKENISSYLHTNFTEFTLMLFIVGYWLVSIKSPLNIGVRHILPTLPLIYILTAESIRKSLASQPPFLPITLIERIHYYFHRWINTITKSAALGLLIIWLFLEIAIASPFFLSYYNEGFGWRTDGFYYATDSNFDWGQDLKRLKNWVETNLDPKEKIAVDYFGGGSPNYYLGDRFIPWWSAKGSPKEEGIEWLAVSVNTLQGAFGKPAADFQRSPADEYRWLNNPYGPTDRAGVSIFIYRL